MRILKVFLFLFAIAQVSIAQTVCPITLAPNQVDNGSFENGCTSGFESDYIYSANCDVGSLLPSQWTVTSNAQARNGYYRTPQTQIPGEPAPGINKFLIVDADDVAGKDAWRDTVTVTAGVTYFFSSWFSNLHENFDNPPRLKFSVNNVQIGSTVVTPNNTHDWKQFYTVWTANVTGQIVIRIENVATGTQGNDLGLDGISFSTSCEAIKDPSLIGQDSKLPKTISICDNGGSVTLDPLLPTIGYSYKWKKDPDLVTVIGTNPTYTTSTPGRYFLCYEVYTGCPRTDTVDVVTDFNVDLGPDINLCNPAIATIKSNVKVPPATIKWYKDNVLISYEVGPNLVVNTPGVYKIEVSAPNCGTVTDEIVVTSSAATPINATYCSVPANLTLQVTPQNNGKYKWWKDATSTDPADLVQRGGDTYNFTATANGGYTFYVEDTASVAGSLGPIAPFNSNGIGYNKEDYFTVFQINQAVEITSLQLDLFAYNPAGTFFGIFDIYKPDKTTLITSVNSDALTFTNLTHQLVTLTFTNTPFKLDPSMGSYVYIKLRKGGTINGYFNSYMNGVSTSYPYMANPGNPLEIIGVVEYGGLETSNKYGAMLNIQVQSGSGCGRIPVRAIDDCPPIVCSATAPTSVSVDSTLICTGTVTDITLTATGGTGDKLVWYEGFCGGTKVGEGSPLTIAAPTATTTYYARYESTIGTKTCETECIEVTVTVTPKIDAIVVLDTIKLCNQLTTPIVGNNPAPGTSKWSVYQGSLSISDVDASSTEAFNIKPREISKLVYTIEVGFCKSTDTLVIISDTLYTMSKISGKGIDTCANTSNLVFNANPDYSSERSYTWEVTGTVTASPLSGPTTTVGNGLNGGKLILIETVGICEASDTITLTVQPNIDIPVAGNDQEICGGQSTMTAQALSLGSGKWTVKTGTGIFTDDTNPTTTITGIGHGVNEYYWTVVGCGGPLKDSVLITSDTMTVFSMIQGTAMDTCANSTGLIFTLTPDFTPNRDYTWSTNGTVTASPITGPQTVVSNGTSGGYLILTQEDGFCSHKDSILLTTIPAIAIPVAGLDQNVCSDPISLNATSINNGSGKWSVKSGSGIFLDDTDPNTTVSGISNGANEFYWTVDGCGGPLKDSVIITLGSSDVVVSLSVPTDTLCFFTARTIVATVTGGSGDFEYVWTASDGSFNKITNTGTIVVTPSNPDVIYTVVVNDLTNVGCVSNIASGTLHAVAKQKLSFNNLITPGGDMKNDQFIATDVLNHIPLLPGTSVMFVNNWGDKIYTAEDYKNDWTPTNISDGVYFYTIKSGCGNDTYKGWVQIINQK